MLIKDVKEMLANIALKKRERPETLEKTDRPALRQIVDTLESILRGQMTGK